MSEKEENEIKLLKQQNELLRQQIEYKKLQTKNENSKMIVAIIIIICIVLFGITLYFLLTTDAPKESVTSNDGNNNYHHNERQCVKWENTYNFDWCKYHFSNGCSVTGQTCVEWE